MKRPDEQNYDGKRGLYVVDLELYTDEVEKRLQSCHELLKELRTQVNKMRPRYMVISALLMLLGILLAAFLAVVLLVYVFGDCAAAQTPEPHTHNFYSMQAAVYIPDTYEYRGDTLLVIHTEPSVRYVCRVCDSSYTKPPVRTVDTLYGQRRTELSRSGASVELRTPVYPRVDTLPKADNNPHYLELAVWPSPGERWEVHIMRPHGLRLHGWVALFDTTGKLVDNCDKVVEFCHDYLPDDGKIYTCNK